MHPAHVKGCVRSAGSFADYFTKTRIFGESFNEPHADGATHALMGHRAIL
jgi:hypothetical protein